MHLKEDSHVSSPTPLLILALYLLPFTSLPAATHVEVPITIETYPAFHGTSEWDWAQVRSAHIPSGPGKGWITTMSLTGKTGTHAFHDIFFTTSENGRTWSQPQRVSQLKRFKTKDGFEVVPGDLWPSWHPDTGKVLVTGKTFNWEGGKQEIYLREKVSYSSFDPRTGSWASLQYLELPERDHSGAPILAANAGCNQPLVLQDGNILIPIRYQRSASRRRYTSIVARCSFDGEKLRYLEHGSEHTIEQKRGFYEPSVGTLNGEFFLTLRSDLTAHVAKGKDGIHFEQEQEWTFDDGRVLGSYNTQQHFATLGGGLFLIYTRKGANNDHIFRHRAPLFIAQVDTERLQVIRASEKVLIRENQATLGNSGVCQLSPNEAWVTCAEGALNRGKRSGESNVVHIARIGLAH